MLIDNLHDICSPICRIDLKTLGMSSTWSGCSCGTWKINWDKYHRFSWRQIASEADDTASSNCPCSIKAANRCHIFVTFHVMTRVSELRERHSSFILQNESPEHRGPVTRGSEGRGGAWGPRGGRVVEGGQVGDCRGAGHRYDVRTYSGITLPKWGLFFGSGIFFSYSYFIAANSLEAGLCVWWLVSVNCSFLRQWEYLCEKCTRAPRLNIPPASAWVMPGVARLQTNRVRLSGDIIPASHWSPDDDTVLSLADTSWPRACPDVGDRNMKNNLHCGEIQEDFFCGKY